jgi:hypothetical protein
MPAAAYEALMLDRCAAVRDCLLNVSVELSLIHCENVPLRRLISRSACEEERHDEDVVALCRVPLALLLVIHIWSGSRTYVDRGRSRWAVLARDPSIVVNDPVRGRECRRCRRRLDTVRDGTAVVRHTLELGRRDERRVVEHLPGRAARGRGSDAGEPSERNANGDEGREAK